MPCTGNGFPRRGLLGSSVIRRQTFAMHGRVNRVVSRCPFAYSGWPRKWRQSAAFRRLRCFAFRYESLPGAYLLIYAPDEEGEIAPRADAPGPSVGHLHSELELRRGQQVAGQPHQDGPVGRRERPGVVEVAADFYLQNANFSGWSRGGRTPALRLAKSKPLYRSRSPLFKITCKISYLPLEAFVPVRCCSRGLVYYWCK
jgi:hypothetical protein